MKKSTCKPTNLSLVFSAEQVHDQLIDHARFAAIEFATGLIKDEVKRLCGEPFSHKEGLQCHRGGSQQGYVSIQGGKYHFNKPRVRNKNGEVLLTSYESLKGEDLLDEKMLGKMLGGVSTRKYDEIIDGYSERYNVSKSSVSRSFKRASRKHLDELNNANLDTHHFVALMIDGIEFAGRTIVCAQGFTSKGDKIVVGLREGTTENSELVKDLLLSLKERGFTPAAKKLLACIDGGKALNKGLKDVFGNDVIIARCYLHKLRNLESYVPKEYHPHLRRRIKKLMGLVKHSEAAKELESILEWLSGISTEAVGSMKEAKDQLLTVHKLKMPDSLRKTFSSTNSIESLFSVVRDKTKRVKKWDGSLDQRTRWVASAVKDHEKIKRRIKGYRLLPQLIAELNALAEKGEKGYTHGVSSPS